MFHTIVGLCLYIDVERGTWERPDLMYTIKEVASCMSCPMVAALARLRKMIGFMKRVGNIGVKLYFVIQNQLSVSGSWRLLAMQIGARTRPRGALWFWLFVLFVVFLLAS